MTQLLPHIYIKVSNWTKRYDALVCPYNDLKLVMFSEQRNSTQRKSIADGGEIAFRPPGADDE